MQRYEELGRSTTVDGRRLTLSQRGHDYFVEIDGDVLMSNRATGSEQALAEIGCRDLPAVAGARVLIGGLGMAFTLGAALDLLNDSAEVTVAEVFPAIVDWNRKYDFTGTSDRLSDPRVKIVIDDVVQVLRRHESRFDAVLLDVDNGPTALALRSNDRLYDRRGLASIHRALRPNGYVAVWSCTPTQAFTSRMNDAGFETENHSVRARGRKGDRHTIFLGRRPSPDGRRG